MTKQEQEMREKLGIVDIKVLQKGQTRRYGDSYYRWEITVEGPVSAAGLLGYCQSFLMKNDNPYSNWQAHQRESASEYFKGYYTLKRVSENVYIYEVMRPFCD